MVIGSVGGLQLPNGFVLGHMVDLFAAGWHCWLIIVKTHWVLVGDHCVTPLDVAQADSGDPCLISLRLVKHKVAEVNVEVATSSSLVHIKCRLKRK